MMSNKRQLNGNLNLTVIWKTISCFCNILYTFVARNKVKYIFKIIFERAHCKNLSFSVGALRAEVWPKTVARFVWITLFNYIWSFWPTESMTNKMCNTQNMTYALIECSLQYYIVLHRESISWSICGGCSKFCKDFDTLV